MIDPVVHAALVTLMTWFVNWLFGLIGLQLGSEVVTGLATVLVGYILSLFGLAIYNRVFSKFRTLTGGDTYRPPFT